MIGNELFDIMDINLFGISKDDVKINISPTSCLCHKVTKICASPTCGFGKKTIFIIKKDGAIINTIDYNEYIEARREYILNQLKG